MDVDGAPDSGSDDLLTSADPRLGRAKHELGNIEAPNLVHNYKRLPPEDGIGLRSFKISIEGVRAEIKPSAY